MSLKHVVISADAYMVCLTHALSTEKEEIMGLCIGEIDENRVCHISAVMILRRSDKQPDRVEISPEQLSAASTHAEQLAEELKRPMRVIGWYHSHPHITVWPSHVDVRTQAMYQMMDEGFVGLIFSVFNQDKSAKNRIQMTCFQSINQSPEGEPPQYLRLEIPIHIEQSKTYSRPNLDSLVELPCILSMEEHEMYTKAVENNQLDLLTHIHNAAEHSKSLCHIVEVLGGPLMQVLENRLEHNKDKIQELLKRKDELTKELNS